MAKIIKKKTAPVKLGGQSGKAQRALSGRAAQLKEQERIALGGAPKKKKKK